MLMNHIGCNADRGLSGTKVSRPTPNITEHLFMEFTEKAQIKSYFFESRRVERVFHISFENILRFGIVQFCTCDNLFEFQP